MTTLDVPAVPAGLDARPQVRFTLHCSNCGDPHEGEFGPDLWPGDTLNDLSKYAITEDGWALDVDGRKLVCPGCEIAWCVECRNPIYRWQASSHQDDEAWHDTCEEGA